MKFLAQNFIWIKNMMDNKFTRLTLEQGDRKLVWEMPYEDVGADDLIHAFNTLLIGFTWSQKTRICFRFI